MEFKKGHLYLAKNKDIMKCIQVMNSGAWMETTEGEWHYVDTFGESNYKSQWNIIEEFSVKEGTMTPIVSIEKNEKEPTIHNPSLSIDQHLVTDVSIEEQPKIDNTKAVKFDAGKPKMTLVPPRALVEVAKAMTYGAKKYAADNYLNGGFTQRQLMDSAMRHLNSHLQGEDIDESGNTHLSHAAASIMMLIECIITDRIEDDRWKK